MGCVAMENNDREEKEKKALKDAMEYVMKDEDDVECSSCEVWTTCGRVGVDGLTREEVSKMEVYCAKCMYKMMFEMRNRISAYERRVDELENSVKTLSTLVQGSLVPSGTPPVSDAEEPGTSPRRRARRRNGKRASRSENVRNYSAVVKSNGQSNKSSDDEESLVPESTTSQPESVESESNSSPRSDTENREEENRGRNDDYGFTTVTRTNSRRKKRSINIIGDSMVRHITKIVKCSNEGSGCIARGGAGIREIVMKSEETGKRIQDDGYLIIQGGGNSLKWLGIEATVKAIVDGVDKIENEKKLNVAVCSILPRPRESERYECMRNEVNRRLQEELCTRKAEAMKKKKRSASFLDMDSVLSPKMYRDDGVHFNSEGNAQFGKKVLTWIQERERHMNSGVQT